MILSLILFGSRARGDHNNSSDVDVLGIVERGRISVRNYENGITMYEYPVEYLRLKSKSGDLFLLHLIREGVVIHDTLELVSSLRNVFSFKQSYAEEIEEASAIVWFLLSRPNLMKSSFGRRRLVWALRTILVANGAEQGKAIFSSAALAEFAEMPDLKVAIDARTDHPIADLAKWARRVVSRFGVSRQDLDWPTDVRAQRARLHQLGRVARSIAQRPAKGKPVGLIRGRSEYL